MCFVTTVSLIAGAGCGTADPAAGPQDKIQVWGIQDPQNEPIIRTGIEIHNSTSRIGAELHTYVNDAYKQKLQASMGSPNAPDVFLNWGGGNLAQYVDAGQVVDLTQKLRDSPNAADAFLPSVLQVGQLNGKQYGLPMNGIQPVLLFYNKKVFHDAGVRPPKTFDDLLTLVDEFKRNEITPIVLPGRAGWTELMYLEYLLDRIGGPEKFAAIATSAPGAWQDPAVLKALAMCQQLAEKGAFGSKFASLNYDTDGSKLLAAGKAAMFLMGSWEYTNQAGTNPEFVTGGNLGWVPFPTVAGGVGDPRNVVGNPSNYFSVSNRSGQLDAAVEFVIKTTSSSEYISALVEAGQVPAVKGVEKELGSGQNAEFALFTYRLVGNAPSFTQSWDQALSPSTARELLTNLQKLFLSEITPADLASAMGSVR